MIYKANTYVLVHFILSSMLMGFIACAAIQPHLHGPGGPEVIITGDSDPVSDKLKQHIIERTDSFCKDAGRTAVKRIVIRHKKEEQATQVSYLCVGECSSIDDQDNCVRGQKRVTEEVLSTTKEIHYRSFLATVLGY